MPISLDLIGNSLKVRALQGPKFQEHRDRCKQLKNKAPRYAVVNDRYAFQFWEVPRTEMLGLLSLFTDEEMIIQSPAAKKLVRYYRDLTIPLDQLEPYKGEISFLRPPRSKYQEDYIRLPISRNRFICGFQPGLGKSFSSLMRAQVLGFKKLIVVVPNAILENWKSEIFQTLEKGSLIYHGTPKKRKKLLGQVPDTEIVVTTYTMAGELVDFGWDQIIFDEAQIIARRSTKKYGIAEKLVKKHPDAGVQLLSGTPVLHKPSDLWALTYLLYPELAGDYKVWKNRYELVVRSIYKEIPVKSRDGEVVFDSITGRPKVYIKEIPVEVRPQNLDELHQRTKSYMFRVTRDQHVNFEDAVDIIPVGLKGKQQKLYTEIGENMIAQLSSSTLTVPTKLAALTRFLQVCEGAFNLEPAWKDSGKVEYIKEIAKEIDDKLIVWSRFKPITYILQDLFPKDSVVFNGDLNAEQKALAIWSFQGVKNEQEKLRFEELKIKHGCKFGPGQARLFFGVIDRYSSLGFNLHSGHRQIFSSFSWNGNVNQQAADRIKRPDQAADIVYTEFLVAEEIEQAALSLVLRNYKVTTHIVDGSGSLSYQNLSELEDLFKRKFA